MGHNVCSCSFRQHIRRRVSIARKVLLVEHIPIGGLIDGHGNPLTPRLVQAISGLLPRLVRQFPAMRDEVLLTLVVDQAARKLAAREAAGGPIGNLHGYVWVALRNAAMSQMRRGAVQLLERTHPASAREGLSLEPRDSETAARIERRILLRELMSFLSPEERRVLIWRAMAYRALKSRRLSRVQWCRWIRCSLVRKASFAPLPSGLREIPTEAPFRC